MVEFIDLYHILNLSSRGTRRWMTTHNDTDDKGGKVSRMDDICNMCQVATRLLVP